MWRSTWIKLEKLRQAPGSECSPIGACCRISWMFEDSPSRTVQHSTGFTLRSNSSRLQSQAFNKQRKWHITPSLSRKSCTEEKKKTPLQLFNKSKFIWSTDKKKWRGFFQGLHSIWQQFGGIVYFGPSVWSMIDDRRENHEPLAWAQTCKLLSADCCILLDIYQVEYSMPPYLQPGSSWSIPLKEGGKRADVFALLGGSRNPSSGQWAL